MKLFALTGAAVLSSMLAFSATAAELSPEEQAANAVSSRQAVFKLLAFSNAPLGGMARGGEYDEAVAMKALDRVATLADMIPALFAMDTSGSDAQTRANSSIWSGKADFDKMAMDLVAGTEEARAILQKDGASGVRQAVGAVGRKCGGCHDLYRLD